MIDRQLIEDYAAGAQKLSLAIRGLKPEDLQVQPPPDAGVGLWSIRQVVVHLADCDMVFADRMKRIIAEDNPALLAFDENRWAEALLYQEQSAEEAAALIGGVRRQMAGILRRLPDAAFERFGTHSRTGKVALSQLLAAAVKHLDHHLKFVHEKRARMGKEMW